MNNLIEISTIILPFLVGAQIFDMQQLKSKINTFTEQAARFDERIKAIEKTYEKEGAKKDEK